VVAVGLTLFVPLSATVPIPGLIETEVAFAVVQLRVELPFAPMEAGLALKVMVGAVAAARVLPVNAIRPICRRADRTNDFRNRFRIEQMTPE
jgi:hypothetical protein